MKEQEKDGRTEAGKEGRKAKLRKHKLWAVKITDRRSYASRE